MIIYSVQITIQKSVSENWLAYMQQKHIREVMDTGCFSSFQLLKQTDFEDDINDRYIVNYACVSEDLLQKYLTNFAASLREDVVKHFEHQFTAERKIYKLL